MVVRRGEGSDNTYTTDRTDGTGRNSDGDGDRDRDGDGDGPPVRRADGRTDGRRRDGIGTSAGNTRDVTRRDGRDRRTDRHSSFMYPFSPSPAVSPVFERIY